MTAYRVLLTDDAADEFESLYDYIAARDSPGRAAPVLDEIERVLRGPSEFPERGSHPKKLSALGIREFREVFFKPYRIVYRVVGDGVYVMLIADGRRDMEGLLARRLLGKRV